MKDSMYEKYLSQLIATVIMMNEQAAEEDLLRNRVNYGAATAYASVISDFGHSIDICVYGDGDFLISAKIVIDGEIMSDFKK